MIKISFLLLLLVVGSNVWANTYECEVTKIIDSWDPRTKTTDKMTIDFNFKPGGSFVEGFALKNTGAQLLFYEDNSIGLLSVGHGASYIDWPNNEEPPKHLGLSLLTDQDEYVFLRANCNKK